MKSENERLRLENQSLSAERDKLLEENEKLKQMCAIAGTGAIITTSANVGLIQEVNIIHQSIRHENDLIALKRENIALAESNKKLQEEIDQLTKKLEDIVSAHSIEINNIMKQLDDARIDRAQLHNELNEIKTSLSSRQIACNIDSKLLKYVFLPVGRSPTGKPFHFRSFKNLKAFLSDQKSNDDICGPHAREEFDLLPANIKQETIDRLNIVISCESDVIQYINIAKKNGDKIAHTHTNYDEMLQFFEKYDTDIADAHRALKKLVLDLRL